jgi:hypothetical protein
MSTLNEITNRPETPTHCHQTTPPTRQCLPHTWLFCVEIQLIAVSIPLVLLLQRARRAYNKRNAPDLAGSATDRPELAVNGVAADKSHYYGGKETERAHGGHLRLLASRAGLLGAALVLLGALLNFGLVYTNQLPPAWFNTFPDADQKKYYFGTYLTKAWTHLSTFVIGLYAGYLARSGLQLGPCGATTGAFRGEPPTESDSNHGHQSSRSDVSSGGGGGKPKEEGRASFWTHSLQLAALACLVSMVFLTFGWSTRELPSPLVAGLYDSASRLVWSLALVGLMMRLCQLDASGAYSGWSRLFSGPVCLALGRLSFLAYLVAPTVHTLVLAVQEQSLFPSLYLIFHVILGNLVITYLFALALCLMIEQPVRLFVGWLTNRLWPSTATSTAAGGGDGDDDDHCAQPPAAISSASATTNTSATSLTS